jgi:hypothetical protein
VSGVRPQKHLVIFSPLLLLLCDTSGKKFHSLSFKNYILPFEKDFIKWPGIFLSTVYCSQCFGSASLWCGSGSGSVPFSLMRIRIRNTACKQKGSAFATHHSWTLWVTVPVQYHHVKGLKNHLCHIATYNCSTVLWKPSWIFFKGSKICSLFVEKIGLKGDIPQTNPLNTHTRQVDFCL